MRVSDFFILKTASLGLAVLMSTSSLFAQQSWQFETTRAPLSIANDGSITLGSDHFSGTVDPSGYFSISDAGTDFVVSSNQDLMVGTNSTPAELPLRILTKRPTDLQLSELAGAWQYREYAILQPESGSAIYPIEIQSLGIDLETSGALKIDGIMSGSAELGSAQNVILNVGNESFDFAINASKDLMASISQSQGDVLLHLIVRVDNGGNTADLAGPWTLARFGINLGFPDMSFALTNADLSVAADGTTRLGGESITLSSSGNGTVTVTD